MKLHERITQLREELGLTIQNLYNRSAQIFGKKKALSYRTLQRIEKGYIAKFSSVLKICCAMGVPLETLLKGTELENRMVIRKKERPDEYVYNDKVQASVVSSPNRTFLALEMTLKPGGTTPLEQAPPDQGAEKWIYVVEGTLTCHLGAERFILTQRDTISFESTLPHSFENAGTRTCVCVTVQNPKQF